MMMLDRGELQAAGAMTATLLLIVALGFFIFYEPKVEKFVLPWPSMIDACLTETDRALHMCIGELVEQHRPPND